ncbi:NAD(P)/FAD-dependent oxidoreductase [bacterium]|nr:NAD(P)/FAD-dependent oxidoreductase [bacterium]
MDKTIAIIGAGPGGSMLAYKLALYDKKVLLYDHKAPWEKPCGGMLGPDTINEHPELENYPYQLNLCNGIVYISPRNDRKLIPAEKVIPVVSRIELNRFLLDMARNSGAEFIQQKVLDISQDNSQWIIETNDSSQKADLIVGADGVNSIVRKTTIGTFPKEHLALTCGYILTGIPENQYITKFLDMEGYIWVISRADHTSAGIGAKLGTVSGKDLFEKLDDFLCENYAGSKIKKKYSALIPTATDKSFFDKPCCGDNWVLVGDAAGHVDPVVGEGIYYALKSAKVAAQAILNGDIHSYDTLWRDKYVDTLKQGASFRQNLSTLAQDFNPELFGAMMYNEAIGSSFFKEEV